MEKIQELKIKLADAKETLADLDGEIKTMKARQSAIAERIASVAAELTSAETAAKASAVNFAAGRGTEEEIMQAQTVLASLKVKQAAFQSVLEAITTDLTKLQEPRKAAAARVDRLQDMIYSRISELELEKARIFIRRSAAAFYKKKDAYFAKHYFEKEVASLVNNFRHDDSGDVAKAISQIYGLDA